MKKSPETRAVELASGSVKAYFKHLKEYNREPFGKQHADNTHRRKQDIADSPAAVQLISEGYPEHFAHRVARLEKEGKIAHKTNVD